MSLLWYVQGYFSLHVWMAKNVLNDCVSFVCVCEREREERESLCVCVCMYVLSEARPL